MVITERARRLVYAIMAVATFVLHFPVDLPAVQAVGFALGQTLFAWGIPALALWLRTRKNAATGLGPYIAPAILWLVFFAAHVLSQIKAD
jgi:hypothetical protein